MTGANDSAPREPARIAETLRRLARRLTGKSPLSASFTRGERGGRHDLGSPHAEAFRQAPLTPADAGTIRPGDLTGLARRIVAARQRRKNYIDPALLHDPAWDILLALFIASDSRKHERGGGDLLTADVPPSTALRYIQLLTSAGLVTQGDAPDDGRKSALALSPEGLRLMRSYLQTELVDYGR